MFTPSLDWGNEIWTRCCGSPRPGRSPRSCTLVVLRAAGPLHHVGPAVLADHRRLLQGPREHRVWALLRVLLVSVMMSVRIDVLLSYYSNDCTPRCRWRSRAPARGNEAVKQSGVPASGSRSWSSSCSGRHLHRPDDARHLPDAAVHHPVAGVADRPAHRRLADGKAYYRAPVHRRHDRQPRPAHPAGHRHLHHRHRAGAQHPPTSARPSTLLFGAINVDGVGGRRSPRSCGICPGR